MGMVDLNQIGERSRTDESLQVLFDAPCMRREQRCRRAWRAGCWCFCHGALDPRAVAIECCEPHQSETSRIPVPNQG